MIKLNELTNELTVTEVVGNEEVEITGLEFDSREVGKGSLFVAVKGTNTDGHQYINKAVDAGAVAVLCEIIPDGKAEGITYIKTKDTAIALGRIASAFYGYPSQKMKLVGVTGTNGKTTIASLLHQMTLNMGHKAGLISTITYKVGENEYPSSHTTPDPLTLNRLMKEMADSGCAYCFMEVSSHAIHQKRIAGLDFDGAVFTNISHDHLDYHKTFDAYIKAKKYFFDELKPQAFALSNIDDKNGLVMLQNTKACKETYSLRSMATYKNKILESYFDGTLMAIDGKEVWTHFVGKFNAYNLLAVYGAALLLGFEQTEVLVEISKLKPVAGRFEVVRSTDEKFAIVDYAHTPDALDNVLSTIAGVRTRNENLICIVGAGGDRDKTKRPKMAALACKYGDKIILTSDNPRSEKPEDIIEDMKAGVDALSNKNTLVIVDRREAIKTAVMLALPGDIILIAGKGHETYQEVNGVRHHFDDKEEVQKAMGII
ncbi:MAG: UDP-N-acetylmuramoyl-L-alanyl-D-glutamate--2,6-diaminopimelate ligase [Prolixibacteraceae bacterium]|jgi:UDP-N-acetylmuramoyl-L-alanyl-D-glutamate--2,6-diaminopimelate ligase|nr:UDP-N-acetylmuramoyl-L-alanyl-D-glutamate--2,6-diaminopimelate ligase [Prolixibacteraceae bacterium]